MKFDSIVNEDILSGSDDAEKPISGMDKTLAENRDACLFSSNTAAYQNFFLLMGYAAVGMAFSVDGRY